MGRTIDADALKAWFKDWCEYDEFMSGYVCKLIDEQPTVQPTVQPQRRKGNWVCIDGINYECDQCGCVLEDWIQGAFYNYCPNCGADMRGGEQDEA